MNNSNRAIFLILTIIVGVLLIVTTYNKLPSNSMRRELLLPQKLLDRYFLRRYDWKNERTIQDITKDWKSYTGSQDYKNKDQVLTVLKNNKTKLLSIPFEVQLRKYDSDQTFEIIVRDDASDNNGNFPEEFKDKFMKTARKIWGKPYKIVDKTYFSANKENGVVDFSCEWFLKNSQIKFEFSGVRLYGKWISEICYLIFTKKGRFEPLKDLVYLEFQGEEKYVGLGKENKTTVVRPFIFVIDFNSNTLRRRDLSIIANFENVSEETIQAKWEDKRYSNIFSIDRRMGTFEWNTRLKSNQYLGADSWGKYKKINGNPKPKF